MLTETKLLLAEQAGNGRANRRASHSTRHEGKLAAARLYDTLRLSRAIMCSSCVLLGLSFVPHCLVKTSLAPLLVRLACPRSPASPARSMVCLCGHHHQLPWRRRRRRRRHHLHYTHRYYRHHLRRCHLCSCSEPASWRSAERDAPWMITCVRRFPFLQCGVPARLRCRNITRFVVRVDVEMFAYTARRKQNLRERLPKRSSVELMNASESFRKCHWDTLSKSRSDSFRDKSCRKD